MPGSDYSYLWSINRVTDTVGNYIEFIYAQDPNTYEYYLERIKYSGNTQAGLSPYNSIRFKYETRPDKGQRHVIGGSDKILSTKRLSSIETYASTSKVREFLFSYVESSTSGRSLLVEVLECSNDNAEQNCLSPMSFDWTQGADGFIEHQALELPFDLRDSDGRPRGTIIDINKDGRSDAVQAYGGNRNTWINTLSSNGEQYWEKMPGEQLPASLFTGSGKRRAQLIDVDGDGQADLVEGHEGSNRDTFIRTENGWVADISYKLPRPLWLDPFDYTELGKATGVIRDVDGDGLRDLIISYNGQNEEVVETYLNLGGDCGIASCNWQRVPAYDLPYERMFVDIYNSNSRQGGWLRDINGDGLPEYILAHITAVRGICES